MFAWDVQAQFPLVRSLEVRSGQAHIALEHLVQDANGLLWVSTDDAVLRTDGELVEVVLRVEPDHVLAMARYGDGVLIATEKGMLLHCSRARTDTVLHDPELRSAHVSDVVVARDSTIWMSTFNGGIARVQHGELSFVGSAEGMPDDHVNALDLFPDGRVVAATDQGLAICQGAKVVAVHGEDEGAPDNLIFCVDVAPDGTVWAGTDARGVFQWDPDHVSKTPPFSSTVWTHGSVRQLIANEDMVWAGTADRGPIAIERGSGEGVYRYTAATGMPVLDMLSDAEMNVWWCDGTELLHRADPAVLIVPEHEGLDLRHITAICTDAHDRIWFATEKGLFRHVSWFSEDQRITQVPLPLDPHTPIVSLAADKDGTVWAATFGGGVIAILESGAVIRYSARDGLSNNNVLAVRAGERGMWFATLEGVTLHNGQQFVPIGKEAGFVFDVMEEKGVVYAATDGNGIVRIDGNRVRPERSESGTYYSLVRSNGVVLAAGPLTGLCTASEATRTCW
ncbi:MAG TPA: hypothetical protein PK760_08560, partial [Flavobacteriales bacterium]|nr:hypothetical protein [Flavobacteriales bacterium]